MLNHKRQVMMKSSEDIQVKTGSFELCVPTESVTKRHDFGSFEIAETETGILFHVRGGYDVFVQPRMVSLYGHLKALLDERDRLDEMREDERGLYDSAFNATIVNMEIPLFMASKDTALFDIAATALKHLNAMSDEALNAPLQPETPEENGEFQRMVDAFGEIDKSRMPEA